MKADLHLLGSDAPPQPNSSHSYKVALLITAAERPTKLQLGAAHGEGRGEMVCWGGGRGGRGAVE